jgi:transcriptional regulator with XRE-family HTH domain
MKRFSYSERDYAFGQAMLTLRTAVGLTQADLAERLRVSRKAIGRWEGGSSYPKAEHLKALLAFAVEQHAFPAGREEEEVRAFWQVARQKVSLDEPWLQGLLGTQRPRLALVAPRPIEQTHGAEHDSAPHAGVSRGSIGARRWMCRASMGARGRWHCSPSGWSRSAAGW